MDPWISNEEHCCGLGYILAVAWAPVGATITFIFIRVYRVRFF